MFAFGGASLMIAFTPVPDLESTEDSDWFMIIKYICLVLNPFMVAYGSVMMR